VPRAPDPQLEERVRRAALRLLDAGGLPATTMRAVAREAGTSTPTIYERFPDRESLLQSLRQQAELELTHAVVPAKTVNQLVRRLLDSYVEYPYRFELIADTFSFRLTEGYSMPVYELLKQRLTSELGVNGIKRGQLALGILSLILGTARGMIAAGSTTGEAKDLYRTFLGAARMLLAAFSKPTKSTSSRVEV
jgi:AcrR family transcriptional regulator